MKNIYPRIKGAAICLSILLSLCIIECIRNPASSKNKDHDNAIPLKNDRLAPSLSTDYFEPISVVPVENDLDRIKKRGKLIALTGFSPHSYFIYKGRPLGYEYELLSLLATHLDVNLEVVVVNDMAEIFKKLNQGEGDIIADNLIVTKEMESLANFTKTVATTRQVLIQKKPFGWKNLSKQTLDKLLLRNPLDLIGKQVYVRKNSAYQSRLENLSEEIGGDINIIPVAGDTYTEDIIAQVAEGKITYTVADERIAKLNARQYPDLDISTAIGFPQRIAWAVRENAPKLQNEVNNWLTHLKKEAGYTQLYNKYYGPSPAQRICHLEHKDETKISEYDALIKKYAKKLGWDWRMLASLVYQESKFDSKAKSWVGACGLMQLMPVTAKNFGIINAYDPEESLKAGVAYIQWLDMYWKNKVKDKNERIKFIMASYNVGQEHIADAQRLARKYHKNPAKWDGHVAYFIVQKANPKFWSDPVVKNGYCRGKETYNYVSEVLQRFNHYKNLIKIQV